MQKLYSFIINNIYKHFTRHINEDLRMMLVIVFVALMNGVLLFNRSGELYDAQHEMITAVFLLLITIFSISGELRLLEWNKAVFYPFVLFGLSIFVISLVHRTGLLLLAAEIVILFPALYCIWMNNGRIPVFFSIVSVTVVLEGLASFVYCFLLSEQGQARIFENRYSGFSVGPNQFGEMGVAILIAGLYIFVTYKESFAACVLSSAGLGVGISYVIVSSCRTAMLAELLCILSAAIYSTKLHILKKDYTTKRLAHACITIMISAGIMFIGLQLDNINYKNIQGQSVSGSVAELPADDVNDPEIITTIQPEEQNSVDILDRFSYSGDINSLSSGRIRLWKCYIDNTSPWGKDDYWVPSLNYEGKPFDRPAHNNIIEYTYRCGYLSGAIYVILYIVIGVAGLRLLFRKANDEYYLIFCIMCIGSFSIYAILEWAALITRLSTCMYYLSLAPVMFSSASKDS